MVNAEMANCEGLKVVMSRDFGRIEGHVSGACRKGQREERSTAMDIIMETLDAKMWQVVRQILKTEISPTIVRWKSSVLYKEM